MEKEMGMDEFMGIFCRDPHDFGGRKTNNSGYTEKILKSFFYFTYV